MNAVLAISFAAAAVFSVASPVYGDNTKLTAGLGQLLGNLPLGTCAPPLPQLPDYATTLPELPSLTGGLQLPSLSDGCYSSFQLPSLSSFNGLQLPSMSSGCSSLQLPSLSSFSGLQIPSLSSGCSSILPNSYQSYYPSYSSPQCYQSSYQSYPSGSSCSSSYGYPTYTPRYQPYSPCYKPVYNQPCFRRKPAKPLRGLNQLLPLVSKLVKGSIGTLPSNLGTESECDC